MTPNEMDIFLDNTNVIRTPTYEGKHFSGGIGLECFNAMKKYQTNVAQIEAATGETDTYGVLLQYSIRTAMEMKIRGITQEDIVGLCSSNNRFSCIPFYASMFLGAKFTAFDPGLTSADMVHLLGVVTPKIIFVEASAIELVENALFVNGNTSTEIVVVLDKGTSKYVSFYEFLVSKAGEEHFRPSSMVDNDRTAVILCSSGTTGLPKGIEHSHYVLLNKVRQFPVPGLVLIYASFYWISAVVVFLSRTLLGGARLILTNFEPNDAWNFLYKYEIPYAVLTTLLARDLLNCAQSSRKPHNLKLLSIMGENVAENVMAKANQMFPGALVFKGYGLTETAGVLTAFRIPEDVALSFKKSESVGRPIAGIAYKVVDVETGKNVGFNQPGELRLHSEYLMKGYHNLNSTSAYDEEGWLKTGDIVYYDRDFCFYVLDRIKEVIKYRIWHVAPAFLERILNSHPAVDASVVVGIPNEKDGEHPLACVMLKQNTGVIDEIEIRKFVDQKVDDQKKLRGGVKFFDSFPLTPTGKIARRKLRESLTRGII